MCYSGVMIQQWYTVCGKILKGENIGEWIVIHQFFTLQIPNIILNKINTVWRIANFLPSKYFTLQIFYPPIKQFTITGSIPNVLINIVPLKCNIQVATRGYSHILYSRVCTHACLALASLHIRVCLALASLHVWVCLALVSLHVCTCFVCTSLHVGVCFLYAKLSKLNNSLHAPVTFKTATFINLLMEWVI